MSRLLQIAILLLLMVGCAFTLGGLWIPVKGMVAQQLLLRAWKHSLATGEIVKPWPWADTWPVGRLQNQRLEVDLIVLEGESGEVLAFGPGHLFKSSGPGEAGHCILVGHRDTSFSFLRNLTTGDRFGLQGKRGTIVYQVQTTTVIAASTLYLDVDQPGLLTLITCYPFDSITSGATLRFVVTAEAIFSEQGMSHT